MKERKCRIGLKDTIASAIVKVAGGNMGAMSLLMGAVHQIPKIDPDNFFAEMGLAIACDSTGVYESDIWILYKDICKSSLPAMMAVFRAHQLGFCDDVLKVKVEEVNPLWDKVCERLPNFQKRN